MRKPLKPWSEQTQAEVLHVLTAIAEGYNFQVHNDRIIVIDNPDWDGDPAGDRYAAVDVGSLYENGTPLDPTAEDLEMLDAEPIEIDEFDRRLA